MYPEDEFYADFKARALEHAHRSSTDIQCAVIELQTAAMHAREFLSKADEMPVKDFVTKCAQNFGIIDELYGKIYQAQMTVDLALGGFRKLDEMNTPEKAQAWKDALNKASIRNENEAGLGVQEQFCRATKKN